jgi:hypothetical protein
MRGTSGFSGTKERILEANQQAGSWLDELGHSLNIT